MRYRLITILLGLALWATPGAPQLLPSPGPMGGSTQQRYIGTNTVVYPAGFQNVMGVASTNLSETRSTFSNYGSDVWVAAPGEGIISTYPFGAYAAGWGTSFSTPFVTGTVGLLANVQPNLNEQAASSDIANAEYIGSGLGTGNSMSFAL